ncbi:MAG: flagellin [Rhodoferax sp.]
MSVINTNVSSLIAQNAINSNSLSQSTAMQRLSTGLRINGAKDDAAGLAIASKMTSQIRGLDQAVRNSNDAISMLQTADGALSTVTDMLQRMRELAVQSANGTNGSSDQSNLNDEFQQLKQEIGRVGLTTTWNGMNLLDGTGGASSNGHFNFQVGADNTAAQQVNVTIGGIATNGTGTTTAAAATTTAGGDGSTAQESTVTIGGTAAVGDLITLKLGDKTLNYTVQQSDYNATQATFKTNIAHSLATVIGADSTLSDPLHGYTPTDAAGVLTLTANDSAKAFSISATVSHATTTLVSGDILTQANAHTAMAALDTSIASVNTTRSGLGASINRLTYAADNLANISQNASASRSRVQDTDYAKTSTELARTQIIAQASTAMLAQANQSQQSVLALLK